MTDQPPAAKRPRGRPRKARGASLTSDRGVDKWSIRGVPSSVRAVANKSAQARGLTLGDWIAEAIVAYARSAKTKDSSDQLPARPMAEMLVDIQDRLEAIERQQRQGFFARLFGRRRAQDGDNT